METSASLNSGFNVLEALRFLLQLFLFIHDFFFCILHFQMSLASPTFPPARAVRWIRGKREGLGAAGWELCAFSRCRVGDGALGAALSLAIAVSFPHRLSLCSKNICTYRTLLHVGCVPSVVLRGKKRKKKIKKGKAGRKEELFPVMLY